jgi:hypothetical protein
MPRPEETFDPRAIIAALERNYVDYVIIGALPVDPRSTSRTVAFADTDQRSRTRAPPRAGAVVTRSRGLVPRSA